MAQGYNWFSLNQGTNQVTISHSKPLITSSVLPEVNKDSNRNFIKGLKSRVDVVNSTPQNQGRARDTGTSLYAYEVDVILLPLLPGARQRARVEHSVTVTEWFPNPPTPQILQTAIGNPYRAQCESNSRNPNVVFYRCGEFTTTRENQQYQGFGSLKRKKEHSGEFIRMSRRINRPNPCPACFSGYSQQMLFYYMCWL